MENSRYLIAYCAKHNYGKIIDVEALVDEFDTEGNLSILCTYLQICSKGVFKKTSCECYLHGVIDIKDGALSINWLYLEPYPKGWKRKYYMDSLNRHDPNYFALKRALSLPP